METHGFTGKLICTWWVLNVYMRMYVMECNGMQCNVILYNIMLCYVMYVCMFVCVYIMSISMYLSLQTKPSWNVMDLFIEGPQLHLD